MESWHSYPSIYALGHTAIANLFTVPVIVEEKIDGSQFSFGVDEEGELHVRSKGKQMVVDAPEKMFGRAVQTAKDLKDDLRIGWTYRCEYLSKPKHNTLKYDRVPERHLIVFDVNTGHEEYLTPGEKNSEARRLGLESVPLLYQGELLNVEALKSLLDRDSVLGGVKIEGVVVKQLQATLFGPDKKALMGKFVSEAFKEIHGVEWKKSNPTDKDVVSGIIDDLKTEARWRKAAQHLEETGALEVSPRDIPKLMKEVQADILKDCEEQIKDRLFKYAWPKVQRAVVGGLPEWWKEELLKRQFGDN